MVFPLTANFLDKIKKDNIEYEVGESCYFKKDNKTHIGTIISIWEKETLDEENEMFVKFQVYISIS